MCRNIKTLYNFDPPANKQEIEAAALQYVRKVSGYHEPSQANQAVFDTAIKEIAAATQKLMYSLTTTAKPHNREEEARKAHQRALERFGPRK